MRPDPKLRIIAGELRGRRIDVPPRAAVRPTADRVREALFSILGTAVSGAAVLDAYSGSGALGFEALSRGARRVVFIDQDRSVMRTIRGTAERLGIAAACSFLQGSVPELLDRGLPGGPFDLVLADPPYASDEAGRFLRRAARVLAEGGRIVLERDGHAAVPPETDDLDISRTARYGRCCLDFYARPES